MNPGTNEPGGSLDSPFFGSLVVTRLYGKNYYCIFDRSVSRNCFHKERALREAWELRDLLTEIYLGHYITLS